METKAIELKALEDDGSGIAVIATLDAVDHDGDTYVKGAFGDQPVKVLAGHSWQGVPLGKGRVYEKGNQALAEFKLNLDSAQGQEWHGALKFDLANGEPLQEWSYGFRVVDSEEETRDGKTIRVLKALDVFEVSPVVKGAGIDTGTVAIKGRNAFIAEAQALIDFADRLEVEREAEGKGMRPAWMSQIKAFRDRLDALIARADAAEPPDEAAERAEAGKLLAQFEAIRSGQ